MAILQFDGLDHYGSGSVSSNGVVRTNFLSNGFIEPSTTRATTLSTAYGKTSGSLGAMLPTAIGTDTDIVWISKPIQPEQYKDIIPYAVEDFVFLGFAFRMNQNPSAELTIAKVGDHELSVAPDFTICGDGTYTQYKIELAIWNYCELEVNARDSKFRIWMNDRLVYEDTLTETEVKFDKWAIMALYKANGGANQNFLHVDDIYVMDGAGSVNTTRLGKVNVQARYPKTDVQTQFKPSSGTVNALMVDEFSSDDNSTFVFSAEVDATDLYANEDELTVVDENAVVAVAVAISARMTEPDSLSIGAVIKSGEALADGGRMRLKAATYTSEKAIFEIDPATQGRWKPEAVRTLSWGQKVLKRILND